MKKVLPILFCLLSLIVSAGEIKLALLQPLTTPGSAECNPMEISMVRGELRKAFGWQSDFQVLTRMDVDAMLKEQGFQRSGMVDDAQRKQVGVMTGAQYICVSTITKFETQLYIEAYLVDVETGQMTNPATQYAKVKNNDYSTLPNACSELAKEMLGELSGARKPQQPQTQQQAKVEEKPTTPTTRDVTGYVDLGLPSGTLWKSEIASMSAKYDLVPDKTLLPTKAQMEELIFSCTWQRNGNGFIAIGPNGKTLSFPPTGSYKDKGKMCHYGYYLTSEKEKTLRFGDSTTTPYITNWKYDGGVRYVLVP